MKYIFMLCAFLAGTSMPLQSSLNSGISGHLGNPLYGTMISFIGGALISILIFIFSPLGVPSLSKISGISWIYYTGGIYGLIIVTSVILSVPYLGISSTLASVIAGQLVMSVFFDHFGWFGGLEIKITVQRVLGIILLLSGVYLVQR